MDELNMKRNIQGAFAYVEPRVDFEAQLLETLSHVKAASIRPEKSKVSNRIMMWQIRQVAMFAIMILSVVGIGFFTPVSATVRNLYMTFYQAISQKYDNNTKENQVSLNQTINLKGAGIVKVKDALVTKSGICLRFEGKFGEKIEDISPEEAVVTAKDGTKIYLKQEVFVPIRYNSKKMYLVCFQNESKKEELRNITLGEALNLDISFVCSKNEGNDIIERNGSVEFTPTSIYEEKTIAGNDTWINENGYQYRVKNIVLEAWYMKVTYEWVSTNKENEFAFRMYDEKKKEYVSLGADEKQKDGRTITTEYFECLDGKAKKIVGQPVELVQDKKGNIEENLLKTKKIYIDIIQ